MKEHVNHPEHYGGEGNTYEAIKVIEAWGLGFNLGNVTKYISRAGKKDNNKLIQDLEKASWYLNREIENLKKKQNSESTKTEKPQYTAKRIITESPYISNDKYKQILSKEGYEKLYKSGMFFEIYPELTGRWLNDALIIGNNEILTNK
jgi:hypothetical protein